MLPSLRRVPRSFTYAALLALTAGLITVASGSDAEELDPPATPRAHCGPGSLPETGRQGRVPPADRASGRAARGYTCNLQVIGRYGSAGGFKTLRYEDADGHECAYFDVSLTGVHVMDMTNPSDPRLASLLTTPGMFSPHETLDLNQKRGLLVGVAGGAPQLPGLLEVYDVKQDCRAPRLLSTFPVGQPGHESGLSPDGRTFFASSTSNVSTIVAVGLDDPSNPQLLWVGQHYAHGLSISADGNRAYLSLFPPTVLLPGGPVRDLQPPGLRVLDISQINSRVLAPQVPTVSEVSWPSVSFPQNSVPLTIKGHSYLLEFDEFTGLTHDATGAARIIDLADEHSPRVVSDLRLEVNQRANREDQKNDPGASTPLGGYAAHYCATPTRVDPEIVACSFILSGLRVFNISDPLHPREVAYDNPPQEGDETFSVVSAPTFVPERREVWYTAGAAGFRVVRLSPQAWKHP
jgi:hypothetical protein